MQVQAKIAFQMAVLVLFTQVKALFGAINQRETLYW
jgi:hypothetical protein